MVRNYTYTVLLSLYLCWFAALNASPFAEASIDSINSQVNFPLQGTLTITHDKDEIIDIQSFTLENKPLDVSLIKNVKMSTSSNTLVSIFSFQIPGQEKGLYVLPAISMQIGGKSYSSSPSSYEVRGEGTPQQLSTHAIPSKSPSATIFRLEASVDGPTTLYPGERTKLLYRIMYNQSVDINRSELPMVHPEHFQKVGDVQIKDYQLKDVTVQNLTQEIEASELGTFTLGPSIIEGYAYTMQGGEKVYDSTLLKAEAPLITLEVKPFPSTTPPLSFTGGLGEIAVKASLNSPHALVVGDNVQLLVEIAGITNLADMHLPSLECQPGFSGFFQISDIAPLSEVKDKTKIFYVECRPLTTLIDQIPSLEVSSFDTDSGQYIIQKTSPIPVTITLDTLSQTPLAFIPPLNLLSSITQWLIPALSPLEIEGSINPALNTSSHWQKGRRILWIMTLALIVILVQIYLRKNREKHPQPEIPQSDKLFKQALKKGDLHLLEEAFWHRLWEKNLVEQGISQMDKLRYDEKFVSIYSFLYNLQALQYSANKAFDLSLLQRTAKEQFEAL